MKLMFVGDSNKGKTSLLMALTRRGKVNHYQDIKLNLNRKPLSTVGVDLGDWEYAKQTTLITAGKKITFMTWDFGGQVSINFLTCFTGSVTRVYYRKSIMLLISVSCPHMLCTFSCGILWMELVD